MWGSFIELDLIYGVLITFLVFVVILAIINTRRTKTAINSIQQTTRWQKEVIERLDTIITEIQKVQK